MAIVRTTLSSDPKIIKQFRELCKKNGMYFSAAITKLMKEFVKSSKPVRKAKKNERKAEETNII